MARTLSEIYAVAKAQRDSYLELTEFENSSKMSVLDAFTWVTSACIWTFENVVDVFKIDLAKDLQNRINGTPAYFANALLKYQSGDELVMNDEGTSFSYASVDTSKRVITKVAYYEEDEAGFHDKLVRFKIATGDPGSYSRIDDSELVSIRAYLNQILFAGQHAKVVSRIGDILVPRVVVYYDGAVTEDDLYTSIETALNDFIANIDFNGVIYAQKVIDCIQNVEHVTDVSVSSKDTDYQGIYIASYDDDNNLIKTNDDPLVKIDRYVVPNSGYIKQSSGTGEEVDIPLWRDTIILKLEDNV
jgi:hypothetical protein